MGEETVQLNSISLAVEVEWHPLGDARNDPSLSCHWQDSFLGFSHIKQIFVAWFLSFDTRNACNIFFFHTSSVFSIYSSNCSSLCDGYFDFKRALRVRYMLQLEINICRSFEGFCLFVWFILFIFWGKKNNKTTAVNCLVLNYRKGTF